MIEYSNHNSSYSNTSNNKQEMDDKSTQDFIKWLRELPGEEQLKIIDIWLGTEDVDIGVKNE